jgi:hypothetical protein
MLKHCGRTNFYVVGDGPVKEPAYLAESATHLSVPAEPATTTEPQEPTFKFGHMFPRTAFALSPLQRDDMIQELIGLGMEMNKPGVNAQEDTSSIPSGYTYLGQYIAHEITFDTTKAPLGSGSATPNYRSPQIDLDSLYGGGPKESPQLYQDCARLKVGETVRGIGLRRTFPNDLPRIGYGDEKVCQALIPDPRNDENLPLAQLHLAFIRFHNNVVDQLFSELCPVEKLFDTARKEVVQHFQAIILEDFLPTLLDEAGRERLRSRVVRHFKTETEHGVFMPLEFSGAAFRFGHSMVREQYEWNYVHCSEDYRAGPAGLSDLLNLTGFSGDLDGSPRLRSDWVIDWRRFFDLSGVGYPNDHRRFNNARKIDTTLDLHLEKIRGYPHDGVAEAHRSLTVRNLLRGFSFELPTGEEVAGFMELDPLKPEKIASGPHQEILNRAAFRGRTPLWYYVLKEAELNNGLLGPVASCIIVDTFLGLIKKSPYSILNDPEWHAKYGVSDTEPKTQHYEISNLLAFANVVDPVGDQMQRFL